MNPLEKFWSFRPSLLYCWVNTIGHISSSSSFTSSIFEIYWASSSVMTPPTRVGSVPTGFIYPTFRPFSANSFPTPTHIELFPEKGWFEIKNNGTILTSYPYSYISSYGSFSLFFYKQRGYIHFYYFWKIHNQLGTFKHDFDYAFNIRRIFTPCPFK